MNWTWLLGNMEKDVSFFLKKEIEQGPQNLLKLKVYKAKTNFVQ